MLFSSLAGPYEVRYNNTHKGSSFNCISRHHRGILLGYAGNFGMQQRSELLARPFAIILLVLKAFFICREIYGTPKKNSRVKCQY